VRATKRIVIQFSSQSEVGCLTISIATGGLDRRPAPAVIPIVCLYSTGPLKSLVYILFSSRSESRSRFVGCRGCSVVGRDMRLVSLTKDLPHCDSYTRNGRIATTSVSVSRRKQRRLRPGIIPDLYHHIIGVAKTRGRLMGEERRSSGRLGAWRFLGRTFLVLACLEVWTGNWITERAVEGPFSVLGNSLALIQ
jgi:hypothetical protein